MSKGKIKQHFISKRKIKRHKKRQHSIHNFLVLTVSKAKGFQIEKSKMIKKIIFIFNKIFITHFTKF